MTGTAPAQVSAGQGRGLRLAGWLRHKDPYLLAVKRSVRAAVVMPSVFALTHVLFTNPQVSLFGAFGGFALLLLVDFSGPPRTRLVSFVGLFLAGSCFIALGTIVSTDEVLAVAAMAVVGFGVLFSGIFSPQAATASTAALLIFVLPVAVAQPVSAVGPRLLGFAFAGALCIPACMFIWPTPWHDDLRRRLSSTLSSIGGLAAAHAEGRPDVGASAEMTSQLALLRSQFGATAYPPTGAASTAVALAKLVGRAEWVAGSAALADPELGQPAVRALYGVVAETLFASASLVCDGSGHPVNDPDLIQKVQDSIRHLDQITDTELASEVATLIDPGADPRADSAGADHHMPLAWSGLASSLDPSFHARALGFATQMVADATLESVGAQTVGDRRLGGGGDAPERLLGLRLISYLSFRSVWFRNAVRGAAGLAAAVAVVEVTDVEHGFWVVLGTLSVLRSNALGTGATALRAIGGTAVGFFIGSAIMVGVGGHTVLLWALLPLAVLVSGVAPAMISFAAGQAGFTLVVIILFNIIDPVGWRVGLTRIEDVAIGCAVSVVVGMMFWPRGATAALGRALADSFVANSGYLSDAVDRLTVTAHRVDTGPGQRASHTAYLRLDDAFRQYLAERGAKVVPVETVADLFTGSNRLRLAAYTLGTLPTVPVEPTLPAEPADPELDSVAIACAVLRDSYASSHRWYEEFAELLADRRSALGPPPVHEETLHEVLGRAFDDARSEGRGDRLRMVLRMFWADELLESQRKVQADLAGSATLFTHTRQKLLVRTGGSSA
jgi:uncharacterized membrane protein YccC